MQTHMETDLFHESIVFSDECTFHLSDKVNKHNIRIWGSHKHFVEHIRDSPTVNVCCVLSQQKVFFFVEKTIQGSHHLDIRMLKQWFLPQLEQDMPNMIFKQAPSFS
ncbi:hypothetical protein C0J52_12320 [Blattella germanica]|nr:hypothetical protein C0J52_12320 [Blattella germanica]